MKSATKPRWQYPPHLRHVATLPWEIKTTNFLQILKKNQINCVLIASTFVIHPQILIFTVFKIANLSPYWLQRKISMSLFLFTLAINLRHRKFVTADVTAVFVNNQYDIKRRGHDFDINPALLLLIHYMTLWLWSLTFWHWSVVIHGVSHDQPLQ